MARLFDRNMFIAMAAIMVGIIIITFFIADIVNQSRIDTLTEEHVIEIDDLNSRNENFTDYFLQGTVTLDSAREIRETGNYYFDFALYWYSNAISFLTNYSVDNCIENCLNAMIQYSNSYEKFSESQPHFVEAKEYTDRYDKIIDHYISFSEAGQNITLLRYNATNYLKQIVENLSLGNLENVSLLWDLFNETAGLYDMALIDYDMLKDLINNYIFFTENREEIFPN